MESPAAHPPVAPSVWLSRGDARLRLGRALLLVLAMAIVMRLGFLLAIPLGVNPETFEPAGRTAIMVLVSGLLSCGGVVLLGVARWNRLSLREVGWSAAHLWRNLLLGLLGGLACAGIVLAAVRLAQGPEALRAAWRQMLDVPPAVRAVFLLLGLNAAFAEESVFRGYLTGALARRLPPAAAVLIASAVFSAYHLNPRPLALLVKLLLGLVLGALAWRSRSLATSATAHAFVWTFVGLV